ncbi:hypothetical protein LX36DRAFT_457426 [Colletotrichum falcatum]|nr:hypothetical protein LX36DRAFT_457426 [Colletotrichum falcatum]
MTIRPQNTGLLLLFLLCRCKNKPHPRFPVRPALLRIRTAPHNHPCDDIFFPSMYVSVIVSCSSPTALRTACRGNKKRDCTRSGSLPSFLPLPLSPSLDAGSVSCRPAHPTSHLPTRKI